MCYSNEFHSNEWSEWDLARNNPEITGKTLVGTPMERYHDDRKHGKAIHYRKDVIKIIRFTRLM